MIKIRNMNKSFSNKKVLEDINLDIEKGKIYGLIGRNGVGKTTLLNIMGGVIKRDDGVLLMGKEEIYDNTKAIENISLIKESGFYITDIKCKEIVEYASYLYKDWNNKRFEELVRKFEFEDNLKKNYDKLSRGNKSILGIIIGFSSNTEYLLLDEPTTGLDAVYRNILIEILFEEIEEGNRAVVISTHLIDELEKVFEDIIIIGENKIILNDTLENIKLNSYNISGNYEDIFNILSNKNILNIKQIGKISIFTVLDKINSEEIELLKEKNAQINKLGLQNLFIELSESRL